MSRPQIEGVVISDDAYTNDDPVLIKGVIENTEEWRESHPIVSTIAEAAIVWGARQCLISLSNRYLPVKLGHGFQNTSLTENIKQSKLVSGIALIGGLLVSPIVEEYAMRKIPSDYLDKKGKHGPQQEYGVALAGLFAAGHTGPRAVPIPQFIGGLNYWRLIRSRGYGHAVLAHTVQNTLSYVASWKR